MRSTDVTPCEIATIALALRQAANRCHGGFLARRAADRLSDYARKWEAEAKTGQPVFVLSARLSTPVDDIRPVQWPHLHGSMRAGGA